MSRRRWRTAVLWGGCTLCVLIAAVLVMSVWWSVVVLAQSPPVPVPTRHRAVWWLSNFFELCVLCMGVAVLTLLVWRFVTKFPRGHCRRCGYNLKGLTAERCPECGAGFDGADVLHG